VLKQIDELLWSDRTTERRKTSIVIYYLLLVLIIVVLIIALILWNRSKRRKALEAEMRGYLQTIEYALQTETDIKPIVRNMKNLREQIKAEM
jgi:Flp pilus assembly protein TadB